MALLLPPSASGSTSLIPSSTNPLADLLRSPDDLTKLTTHRKRLLKEKSQIDARLNECVKLQLEETKEGLRRLVDARQGVGRLREELIALEQVREEDENKLGGKSEGFEVYAKISKVAKVHHSLSSTAQTVKNLQTMSSKVQHLDHLLTTDQSHPLGPCGPAVNLLVIHHGIQGLEGFRNETLFSAKLDQRVGGSGPGSSRGEEEKRILLKWFERLDDLIKRYEEWLWAIAGNMLDTVREGNGGVIVRLIKIVEFEGKEDDKAVALRMVRKVAHDDSAMQDRTLQANARVLKNYRHKLFAKMTESVHRSFSDAEIQASDGVGFLEDLTWMFKDLDRIETDVKGLFPPDYGVWEFYVRAYHTRLNEALTGVVKSNPEARVLLKMHAWIKEYRGVMKEFEVPSSWLQPALLDGKSQDLIEDYVQLIVDKFDKWTRNLMLTETKEFTSRDAPPEQDPDGTYALQFAMTMFQMANQQVDLAADSGQGAVLSRVVVESARVMMACQAQWIKLVEREYTKQVERPESTPPGLVEYVVALANDQLKAADYAESMSNRLEPLVSAKYRTIISERLGTAIDGYLDVAKRCLQTLIDLIFNDLKPVTRALFSQPGWYIDPLMDQIVETMRDYTADYRGHLNPTLFDLLISDMLVRFLTTWLAALSRVPSRSLRIPAAPQRMEAEKKMMLSFFMEYQPVESSSSAPTTTTSNPMAEFEIIDTLISLLSASPEMVLLDYWQFARQYGPNLSFIESILRGRDDLERPEVNEIIETIRRKVREEGLGEPDEATIMTKVREMAGGSGGGYGLGGLGGSGAVGQVGQVAGGLLTSLTNRAAAYAGPLGVGGFATGSTSGGMR